jgi:bleomycin hydrolase
MKHFWMSTLGQVALCAVAMGQGDLQGMPQWIGPETGMEVLHDWTATEVLSQGATGTCWSYSTTSFLESEAFRVTGELHDFSEMSSVRVNYPHKAAMYLRYLGKHQFGPGALSHDVMNAIEAYGMVPAVVYAGQPGSNGRHDHGELDAVLESMMASGLDQAGSLSPKFMESVEAVLDVYLGELPTEFEYEGKTYTPASFRDAMGIRPGDYVELTSFLHHPVHSSFVLEVPDNYSNGAYINLTLDELVESTVHALEAGYTVAWDADVSNAGFSFRKGLALALEDVAEWEGWSWEADFPEEMRVTETIRQAQYNSLSTTDDHLMHLVGLAEREVDGKMQRFFILKNSWGTGNDLGGRQFVSEAYFRMYTMGVMVHLDGLPSKIRKIVDEVNR